MLVDTDNLVPAEEFRKHLERYVAAAHSGCGPVAVTQGSEVVGFFVSPEDYEAMSGAAVKKLLTARARGRTVTHEEALSRARAAASRKS